VPLDPETRFEKVINFGVTFKEALVGSLNLGDNVYNCHGHTRVFAKAFLSNFRFGGVVSEDAYSYFACKKQGLHFKYVSKARVRYRSPQSLRDHLKQSVRFIQGQKQLAALCGEKLVKEAHAIPLPRLLSLSAQHLFSHPVLFVEYFFINLIAALVSKFRQHAVLTWESATSSKTLIKPE
jgi:cellulose synthase/poly-beta-1,6-N-acetylglucosamine synthase-like glycosyltransferase